QRPAAFHRTARLGGNFIINMGNATADDVEKLVNFVMEKVSENTGYNLEPEIIFV
ncbi:MAG: hypothetical protein II054_07710, partial [Treponema sp.]|nr:hypothetical protein [Treponema sp.]